MNAAWLQALLTIDRRVLALAASALLVVTALEGWQQVLRTPAVEYRQLITARDAARRALQDSAALPKDLAALRAEVARMEQTLSQDPLGAVPEGQQSAALMGRLDQLARTHHVVLVSVRPGPGSHGAAFTSASQEIAALGRYADLMGWLHQLESALGPLVVSRFQLSSRAVDDPVLELRMNITAYRPADATGGVP